MNYYRVTGRDHDIIVATSCTCRLPEGRYGSFTVTLRHSGNVTEKFELGHATVIELSSKSTLLDVLSVYSLVGALTCTLLNGNNAFCGTFTKELNNTKQESKIMTTEIDILAASLIENVKTVGVRFQNPQEDFEFTGKKVYTYKTTEKLEIGDLVVAEVRGEYKVVKVVEVHETLQIDDAHLEYKWIIGKATVSMEDVDGIKEKEKAIAAALNKHKQQSERKTRLARLLEEIQLDESELKALVEKAGAVVNGDETAE